ncbi:MAG TPA: hypothetical protein VKR06_46385 [Ktedonosporobacter sp.]|nr:hypothetical protein [Ktedonosporobacter sp.]
MQNEIECKLLEALFEALIYGKRFSTYSAGYEASIERNNEHVWDSEGRLLAHLDIRLKQGGSLLLDGGAFPIWLSAQIDESVKVSWEMPENPWGAAQSNVWPYVPYLKQGDDPLMLTERYEVRMEAALKQWMLEHGGAALIRSLLRAERARQLTGE